MTPVRVFDAIVGDLDELKRTRRWRFAAGLGLVAPLMALVVWWMGVRADLWERPVLQVVAQFGAIGVGLFVLPAMGVGLLPSTKRSRTATIIACVGLGLVGALGWPGLHPQALRPYTCLLIGTAVIAAVALPVVVLGARRRTVRSVFVVAAGLALAQLNLLTCLCPHQLGAYSVPVHVSTALAIVGAAVLLGVGAQLVRRPRP
ncbi:MAG: hypothetical protein B7733_16530 [Myxococcales bacterium FL481]|nr:MAG: hypothetical protein B7733_16530 [Myxococcales bacterium FL481]